MISEGNSPNVSSATPPPGQDGPEQAIVAEAIVPPLDQPHMSEAGPQRVEFTPSVEGNPVDRADERGRRAVTFCQHLLLQAADEFRAIARVSRSVSGPLGETRAEHARLAAEHIDRQSRIVGRQGLGQRDVDRSRPQRGEGEARLQGAVACEVGLGLLWLRNIGKPVAKGTYGPAYRRKDLGEFAKLVGVAGGDGENAVRR